MGVTLRRFWFGIRRAISMAQPRVADTKAANAVHSLVAVEWSSKWIRVATKPSSTPLLDPTEQSQQVS
jgi:hypothetical protein